jgi:prolyl oligopeptidase
VTDTLHGVSITDPYRWLEDQNSPETRARINAQNEFQKRDWQQPEAQSSKQGVE